MCYTVVHLHFDVPLLDLDTHDRGCSFATTRSSTQYFVARLYFLCRVSSHPVPWPIPLALARTLVDPVHPIAMLLAALLRQAIGNRWHTVATDCTVTTHLDETFEGTP